MTNERELLEAAARAAGMRVLAGEAEARAMGMRIFASGEALPEEPIAWFWAETSGKRCLWSAAYPMRAWNPLHDDGDAFRLAVQLRMPIWFDERSTTADQRKCGDHGRRVETGLYDLGGYAATRLAIVRAAADRTTEQGDDLS